MSDVDIAIIGAGPTGLFAAYYAGFRGLSTVVIDTLPEVGGQVTAMYPEKLIFDVGGYPQVLGRDKCRAHAATVDKVKALPVRIVVNSQVTKINGGTVCESVEINGEETI